MESEARTWESMERMIDHESMWRPDVKREEVRAALEKLYRTEDPSCLEPFLRRGVEKYPDSVIKDEVSSETSIGVPGEVSYIPYGKLGTSFDSQFRLTEPKIVEPSKSSLGDPSAQCDLCEYKPSKPSKKTIRIHKDSIHFGLKYPCNTCKKVSSTKSNLIKHVEENHSGKRHKCTDCKYESHSKNLLKLHIQGMHSCQEFCCILENCIFKTGSEIVYALHQMKHEERKIKCIICNAKFSYVAFLKEHISKTHFGLFCDICFYQPYVVEQLKEHNRNSHGGAFYPCQSCSLNCLSELNLKWHIKNEHNKKISKPKPVTTEGKQCNMCEYKPKKSSLHAIRVHKESVHLGVRHICPQCQYPCTTRSNLSKHILEKHEGRRVKCSSCSFSAPNSGSIKQHNEIKHLGILYYCTTYSCSFSATKKCYLNSHMQNKHSLAGEITRKGQTIYFYCSNTYGTVCDKLFERKYRLEEHYKNVHEQFGYHCDNCDYKTRNQELFKQHLIEHSTTNRQIQHYRYNTTDDQELAQLVMLETTENAIEVETKSAVTSIS